MLSVQVVVYMLLGLALAYNKPYKLTCTEPTKKSATFQKTGEHGQYIADICTKVHPNTTDWTVDLLFNDHARFCNNTHHELRPGTMHSLISSSTLEQEIKDLNCTFICMKMNFEMIFTSCYLLKSVLFVNKKDTAPYDTYYNITNSFNKDNFLKDPKITLSYNEDEISIHLYSAASWTNITVDLCLLQNNSIQQNCPVLSNNCTESPDEAKIHCLVSPPDGCYSINFKHTAPWSSGAFAKHSLISYKFCYKAPVKPPEPHSKWSWLVFWVCGAILVIMCVGVAVWRLRDATALHKRVLRYWTAHTQESRDATERRLSENEITPCRNILLIYAREDNVGEKVADALRALLERNTDAVVHDVFSPGTLACAAAEGAPGDWVRTMLARADCRLVLLQTPALSILYPNTTPILGDNTVTVHEPLLGCTAVYRVPQFGDTLAQFALRLLAHSNAHQHPHIQQDRRDLSAYRKYYIATLSDLQTEVFPQVVPFQRYKLPDAAQLLLQHLTTSEPTSQHPHIHDNEGVQRLDLAVQEFVLHVRNNPDYMMDELVFT